MKILENRLIAFLDVLGFSSQLKTSGLEAVYYNYSKFIDDAKTMVFYKTPGNSAGTTNFEFAQFQFDSIILVSHPTFDTHNVNNFIASVSYLMEMGFKSKLPLRGAIGVGSFLLDEGRNIFMSDSLPEIVHFEGEQEWPGCAVLENAEKIVLEAAIPIADIPNFGFSQTRNSPVHYYNIPLKNGAIRNLLAINFCFFMTESDIMMGMSYLIHPKNQNFSNYFHFLKGLQLETHKLGKDYFPAVEMKVMKTRTGDKIAFLDSVGNICRSRLDTEKSLVTGKW